jgi:hypothetical protein
MSRHNINQRIYPLFYRQSLPPWRDECFWLLRPNWRKLSEGPRERGGGNENERWWRTEGRRDVDEGCGIGMNVNVCGWIGAGVLAFAYIMFVPDGPPPKWGQKKREREREERTGRRRKALKSYRAMGLSGRRGIVPSARLFLPFPYFSGSPFGRRDFEWEYIWEGTSSVFYDAIFFRGTGKV